MMQLQISDVRHTVGLFYNVTREEMIGRARIRRISRPRQVVMTLARELTGASTPRIAAQFGGRDHTTVLYAVRRIAELCKADSLFADEVNELRRTIGQMAEDKRTERVEWLSREQD